MNNNKNVKYSSHWNEIANDRDNFRNNSETYKKSYKSINIDHTFGSLIRLKEYNKNLIKLWRVLRKGKNYEIIKTLSKQDNEFYFDDLIALYSQLDQLTEAGLIDEKNVDDWTVFSGGAIGRKSQQDKNAN